MLGELYPAGTGAGTAASPYIIGPDVTHGGMEQGYMQSFLDGFAPRKPVDVVTWHHYYTAGAGGTVTAAEYTQPAFLNGFAASADEAAAIFGKYAAGRATAPQMWLGETSGAGGACTGADQVIGKFLGVFWYADKLGIAAATGHSLVAKQQFKDLVVSLPGGGVKCVDLFAPAPPFLD